MCLLDILSTIKEEDKFKCHLDCIQLSIAQKLEAGRNNEPSSVQQKKKNHL